MKKDTKIALTVDIEDWYHTPAVTGSDFSFYRDVPEFMGKWDKRHDYISESTAKLLKLFRSRGLKATFFVVADVADNYPGLLESILADGHEIGCHGLHHAIKIHSRTLQPAFTREEFIERTGLAREKLQQKTGQPIIGYRAPGAYVGRWMLECLAELGFSYDSSVNPNSLFKKADFNTTHYSTEPCLGMTHDGHKLMEIPWPHWKLCGLRLPTAGGPFLRFFPAQYIKAGLRDSMRRGDTVFYFHSIDLTEESLPSLASQNSRRPFYFSTSGKKTYRKLENILSAFEGHWVPCQEVYARNQGALSLPAPVDVVVPQGAGTATQTQPVA